MSAKLTLMGLYNYDDTLFDALSFPQGIDKPTAVNEILMRCAEFELLYPNLDFMKTMIGHWGSKHAATFEKWHAVLTEDYDPLYNYDGFEETEDQETYSNDKSHDVTSTTSTSHDVTETSSNTHSNTETTSGEHSTTETTSGEHDVTQTTTGTHNNTQTTNMTTEKQVSAYDASTYEPRERESQTGTVGDQGTTSGTTTDEGTTSGSRTDEGTTSGTTTDAGTDSGTKRDAGSSSGNSRDAGSENETGDRTFTHTLHRYGNQGTTMSQQMLEAELKVRRWNIYEHIADLFADEFCIQVYW